MNWRTSGNVYQGTTQTGGAGIGLALVKELTTAMGGNITLDSAPGQGSCFTLCLRSINTGGQ